MKPVSSKRLAHPWRAIFTLTIFSAYFYAFMEWLFFVTKPSSLSILSPLQAGLVLAVTGGVVALPPLIVLLILFLPARLGKGSAWAQRLPAIGTIVPALVLSVTALILVDNFTYTVFKFGIVKTAGWWRVLYALGFGIVLWWTFRYVLRTIKRTPKKYASFFALGLLAVSMAAILATTLSQGTGLGNSSNTNGGSSTKRPNIIILGSDGMSANYLSAYRYNEDTTPFLNSIMSDSLVAENAFPNASSTTASTTSVLTGKEPATVGVYRYPDVLSEQDSYEHLPGILKQYGYVTVEIGTPYYVDANRLNLLNGFDVVNSQTSTLPALDLLRSVLGNTPSTYFIWTIYERASERLLHIFFIRTMRDPLAEVTDPNARMTDEERIDQILGLVDQSDRPVFIFTHLMDTHGPIFGSSKDEKAQADSDSSEDKWDINLYKDALRNFDNHLEKIYNHLSQTGELDNTILVIYTDHGYRYAVNQRIPIVIHFPKTAFAGSRENNIQIIDIPPTLLDYLGIPVPPWMMGTSFLNGEPPANREIISVVAGSPRKIAPPFYQIKIVQVIVCQKWYALNVQENKWSSGHVKGHTTECEDELLPPDVDVRQKILGYLKTHGFDIKSIE